MIRLSRLVVLLGICWGLSVAPLLAQNIDDVLRYSERNPATGAHDMGWLGANTTAGAGSYTALFGNPAGLGWTPESTVSGVLLGGLTNNETRFQSPSDGLSGPFNDTQSGYRIGNAAVTYRVPTAQGSLVFGGAINRTRSFDRTFVASGMNAQSSITDTFLPTASGFSVDGDGDLNFDRNISRIAFLAGAIEFFDADFQEGRYPFDQAVAPGPVFGTNIEQRDDLIETGGLYEASFGGAVEVAPRVMLGGSFHVSFGSYTFDRIFEEVDVNNTHTNDLYDVLLDDGSLLRGFDALTVESAVNAELTGIGARFGASAMPNDFVKIGLTVATPTYYTVTETFGTRIETFFNEGGSLSAGNTDGSEFEYDIRTPWQVSAGTEVLLGPLTVAGDVELVDWSTMNISADGTSFSRVNRQIRDLDMTVNAKGGVAYDINALTLRGGVGYQPNPRSNSPQSDRTFFSGGFTYQFGPQLAFDLGWMQERFDDQFVSYDDIDDWNLDPDDPAARDAITAPRITESIVRNSFSVGVRYRF